MPISGTAKVAIELGLTSVTVLRTRCAKRRANHCCSKARIFPRRTLPLYHVFVARMNTRSRLSRVSMRCETVRRHGTTRVDHACESRDFASYTMQVSSLSTVGDTTGVHPTCCNSSPKAVTAACARDFTLHFLPHSSCHLCYDERAHGQRGRAPGREEMQWTLSRWWIRRSRCCASGAA